ncbi:MFS transporter [Arthrobacter pascens]|uniref:MFS transporter n=1 Tax=Arthrobacter pascens TaxID=1677 RepID=UPI00196A774F|nr:MFS transporter [Arthrobacter pascens]MBN3499703.1 MFS transporter [Arthrobacter pascens]
MLARQHAGSMLLSAMAAGLILVYLLGVLAPHLDAELGMNRVQLGSLSTAFYLTAAVLSAVTHLIVRRAGPAKALVFLFLSSGTGCLLVSASTSVLLLLVACCVGGIAAALSNPATNEFLTGMKPPLAILVGAKQSGVQVGALAVGMVVGPLAGIFGWRVSAAVCGAGCYLLAIVAAFTLRSRVSTTLDAGIGNPKPGRAHWATLGYAGLMGGGLSTVNTYLPLFSFEQLGFPPAVAGMAVGVVGVGGMIARIAWSAVAERLGMKRMNLLLCGQAALAAASAGLLVMSVPWGSSLLWVAALILGLSAAAWNSLVYLFVILAGKDVGRISGQIQSAFYFGLMATPIAFGAVVDTTGSYELGWLGTGILFLIGSVVAVRIPKHSLTAVATSPAPAG